MEYKRENKGKALRRLQGAADRWILSIGLYVLLDTSEKIDQNIDPPKKGKLGLGTTMATRG